MIGLLESLTQPGGNPLLTGLAIGLLQSSGPQPRKVGLGEAIGRGLQMGTQLQNQRSQLELAQGQDRREQEKLKLLQDKFAREQAQRARQETFINSLPEDQQSLARAFPEKFGAAAAQSAFTTTGKFEPVLDAQGNVVAQRNLKTNEIKSDPRAVAAQKSAAMANARTTAEQQEAKRKFDKENALRDDFLKQSGDFIKVRDALLTVQKVAENPSAAGDVSLIFAYMKLLDPGSTVREGEQATAAQARGVPSAVLSLYNRVFSGEKLTPEQRQDFIFQAKQVFNARIGSQKLLTDQFRDIAIRAGIDPQNVIIDLGSFDTPEQQGALPSVGSQAATNPPAQGTVTPSGQGGVWTMQDLYRLTQ